MKDVGGIIVIIIIKEEIKWLKRVKKCKKYWKKLML